MIFFIKATLLKDVFILPDSSSLNQIVFRINVVKSNFMDFIVFILLLKNNLKDLFFNCFRFDCLFYCFLFLLFSCLYLISYLLNNHTFTFSKFLFSKVLLFFFTLFFLLILYFLFLCSMLDFFAF